MTTPFIFLFLGSVLFGTSNFTLASELDLSPVEAGLELFNAKKYSDSVIEWHKALQSKEYANSPEVYLNLGLTEFYLKDYGSSLAHLRKAQELKPLSYKIHKTIQFVSKYILEKEFYHVKNPPFIPVLVTWTPKTLWILIYLGLIGFGTLVSVRHKEQGISIKAFFKSYAIYFSLSLMPLFMIYEQNRMDASVFATLVGSEPSPVYTYPNLEAPELGTINVGDAFEIVNIKPKKPEVNIPKGWVPVITPDAPLGWLKSNNFIVHGGKIDPSLTSN